MNTILPPPASTDDLTHVGDPQPIAVIMSAVLARYDLPRAQESSRPVNHRTPHSLQPRKQLAVA
jgi:hypothetical protein